MFWREKKIPWNNRYRKKQFLKRWLSVICLSIMVFFSILFIIFSPYEPEAIPVVSGSYVEESSMAKKVGKILKIFDISQEKFQDVLEDGCPILVQKKESSLAEFFSKGLSFLADFSENNLEDYLKHNMALLASTEIEREVMVSPTVEGGEEDFYLQIPPELAEWKFDFAEDEPLILNGDPVIFLYNTHNAENYKPGESKLEGQNAGVVDATRVLKKTLEDKYGLKTIHSETIHDYPDWSRSYIQSLKTVQKNLQVYKTIRVVFDVHRDAGFKTKTTTTVNIKGKNAASILIVVGTEHERWKENLAFAQKLEEKANEIYPGLIRDIRIRNNRRYNQHVHPQALLLEFGCDLNLIDEACYTGELFAHVLQEVINSKV